MQLAAKLLILIALVGPRVAAADPKADAVALVRQADQDFKLARFEIALAAYTRAYELVPRPALLFNIGQCHRNLGQLERALHFYRGFLRDDPTSPNRTVVEELIRDTEVALESERKRAEAARVEAARVEAARVEAARVEAARVEAAKQVAVDKKLVAPPHNTDKRDRIYEKWWFWTAVGGVALATGSTIYYFSGDSRVVPPGGSLGGLDRR